MCPIDGCGVAITSDRLMCHKHWYMVPSALRQEVWRAWRARLAALEPGSAAQRHEHVKAAAIEAVQARLIAAAHPDPDR